ncbi:surface lipoprotein assembly modifier [Oceaniglobus trochenteri]|uniref:surface lipoprotein assembly modifier n=1 Tax=Oceaniglobus trochenteri TaxID=2763260 RepID=UPI001D001425|nr:surface lipoprotein assembly modifier [Oceaniglobus trochenteri]
MTFNSFRRFAPSARFAPVLRGLVLSLALLGGAAQAGPLETAETLVANRHPAEALEILSRIEPTPQTAIRLAWARANAHIQRNEPRAALPYLETLVRARPAEARFRLELGRVLFLLQQDDRAKFHFERASAAPLTAYQRKAVDGYFDAISRRSATTTFLSFGIRPSNNPGKRTSATTVEIVGGLPVTLNPDARAMSGTALTFGGGVVMRPSLGQDLRARFSLSGEAELYDRGAEDALTLSGEGGLEWLGDRGRVFGFGLRHLHRFDDGTGSYGEDGVYLSFSGNVGRAGQLSLRLDHGYRDYDDRSGSDGKRTRALARYSFAVSPRLALRTSLEWEMIGAVDTHLRNERAEVSVGASYGFEGGLVLGLDLGRSRTRYDGISPLFGAARADDLTTLGARLHHRSFVVQGFAPVLDLRFERNDSTLPFHSYRNTGVSVGLTREF